MKVKLTEHQFRRVILKEELNMNIVPSSGGDKPDPDNFYANKKPAPGHPKFWWDFKDEIYPYQHKNSLKGEAKAANIKKVEEMLKDMEVYSNEALEKSKKDYLDYYSNPAVINKFKNKKNVKKLLEKIKQITIIPHIEEKEGIKNGQIIKISSGLDNAWGYITPDDFMTIHLNLYRFFFGGRSRDLDETVIHEMGHSVGFILEELGETPFKKTQKEKDLGYKGESYEKSSTENYARMQVLRRMLKLDPWKETGDSIVLKWLDKVKKGEIKYKPIVPSANSILWSKGKEPGTLVMDISEELYDKITSWPPKTGSQMVGILSLVVGLGHLLANYATLSLNCKFPLWKDCKIVIDMNKIAGLNKEMVQKNKKGKRLPTIADLSQTPTA